MAAVPGGVDREISEKFFFFKGNYNRKGQMVNQREAGLASESLHRSRAAGEDILERVT
jgi:hypothetical protein